MKTINLIDIKYSEIKYETLTFSDGQPHLRISQPLDKEVKIITRLSLPADLLRLLYTTDALRRMGVVHIELMISYLMAARMDRVMNEGEPLSLKVICNIINSINYQKVTVFDPHSDVSSTLIDNCTVITNHKIVELSLQHYNEGSIYGKEEVYLIAPDSGALKKIYKLAAHIGTTNVIECGKKRDTLTGKLSGFIAHIDDLNGKDCFIVDDICDGGGTFTGLADVLRMKQARSVNLIVSHGIFSKGYDLKGIDKIYTTNSFKEIESTSKLHCFDINQELFN